MILPTFKCFIFLRSYIGDICILSNVLCLTKLVDFGIEIHILLCTSTEEIFFHFCILIFNACFFYGSQEFFPLIETFVVNRKFPLCNHFKCCKHWKKLWLPLTKMLYSWFLSSYVEWNVLYTTQISQKAKKYHDGVLRLSLCGSHMNQVSEYPKLLFVGNLFLKNLHSFCIYCNLFSRTPD